MARRAKLLSDRHWEKIAAFLPEPEQSKRGGRKFIPNRPCFEGILWTLWTGAPWKALPDRYPSPSTCRRRLQRRQKDGTWLKSLPFSRLADRVIASAPRSMGKQVGEGSVLRGLGDLFGDR